jgi:dihydropteroate synthase
MTQLVGIVNLTADSFSGDGVLLNTEEALSRIDGMMADGAAVIDIGAESTRPGARPLSAEEEWQRLAPLVQALGSRAGKVHFSIDTRHAGTARKALQAGFSWINDVSGGGDAGMLALAHESGCTLVLMHCLGIPADPARTIAANADPVEEVLAWAQQALAKAEKQGVKRSQIVLDPGIGFGKTAEQSLALIKHIARLKALGARVLVGHSRKSFLALFTDKPATARDPETLAVSVYLAAQPVDYLRVHDVKSHAAMLRIRERL